MLSDDEFWQWLILGPRGLDEPNRRQQLAMDRIERAVSELASVLLSSCQSAAIARVCIHQVRSAVAPAMDDILAAN